MAADDRGNGRNGGLFSGLDVKERLIAALLAVILGGGGAAGYMGIKPPRPDPWTGTDARTAHREMAEEFRQHIEALENDIRAVNAKLQQHLVRGEAGFFRIQRLEEDVRELKANR